MLDWIKMPARKYLPADTSGFPDIAIPRKTQRLVSDNDSHWYVIPADEEEQFRAWVAYMEDDESEEYDRPDYSDCRLNMHPSHYIFENWHEG
jgi:hypothetical protein